MKHALLLLTILTILLISCQNRKTETKNSPLVSVIKMHAAEALLDFTEAKKYQDINTISIYRDPTNAKANPEDVWKEYITSVHSSTKSKIFTNQWKYFEFDIIEKITDNSAEVILKLKNPNDNPQAIIYKLELRQSVWIVVGIEYKKKD